MPRCAVTILWKLYKRGKWEHWYLSSPKWQRWQKRHKSATSYVNGLSFQRRRASVKHVTPGQLLTEANAYIDQANAQIAKALAHAKAWQEVAAEYHAENERLSAELAKAKEEINRLEKKLTAKAGKNKRRWLNGETVPD